MDLPNLLEWLGVTTLRLVEFDWPKRLAADIHDCRYEAWHDGILILKGRGTAVSPQQARMKAFGELLERACVIRSGASDSSGWAFHTNMQQAAKNAKFELIERDLYLCHYLTATPFLPFHLNHPQLPSWIHAVFWTLKNHYDIELLFGKMGHEDDSIPMGCAVSAFGGKHFGVITAQACGDSLYVALEKATLECLRNIANQISNEPEHEPISADEFNSKSQHSPVDHYRTALGSDVADYVKSLYAEDSPSRPRRSSQFWDLTHLTEVILPNNRGLRAVQAKNPFVQEVFFGRLTEKKVNINRLRSFTGKDEFSFKDITKLPHTHH